MKAWIDRMLGAALVCLMVAMTVDVLWGVFTRYLLGSQASWSEELARFLLIWISILGTAYASGQNLHLAIDLFSPRLSPRAALRMKKLIALAVIGFVSTVMLIGGLRLIYITFTLEQTSAAMQIPMGVVYSVIPLSGVFIIYYKVVDLRGTQQN